MRSPPRLLQRRARGTPTLSSCQRPDHEWVEWFVNHSLDSIPITSMNVFRQLVVSISVQTAAESNAVSPSPAHPPHDIMLVANIPRADIWCSLFGSHPHEIPQIFHPFALPKMCGGELTQVGNPTAFFQERSCDPLIKREGANEKVLQRGDKPG